MPKFLASCHHKYEAIRWKLNIYIYIYKILGGQNEWQQVCTRSNPGKTGRSCEGANFSWLSSKVFQTLTWMHIWTLILTGCQLSAYLMTWHRDRTFPSSHTKIGLLGPNTTESPQSTNLIGRKQNFAPKKVYTKVCGCYMVQCSCFSNFYHLDLHNETCVVLASLQGIISKSRLTSRTSLDIVLVIGSTCLLIPTLNA
jgi:hypothetical protein